MALFEELVSEQRKVGVKIQDIIRNYKKDSTTRHSTIYFQERLRRLDKEWADFETNDNKIRLIADLPLAHDYFANDYYSQIMTIVQNYKEIFEAGILTSEDQPPIPDNNDINLDQAVAIDRIQQQAHNTVHQPNSADPQSVELTGLIRRQTAMLTSLERLLRNTDLSHNDLQMAKTLWQDIQNLHFKLFEQHENPSELGYSLQHFMAMEAKIRIHINRAINNAPNDQNAVQMNIHSEPIPMPKITLPKFDGNQMKWQEFYDLFQSLVVSQPTSKVQKMWYLKSYLVGEASNLIKHFAITNENFDAAWAIIVERYNNKRVLVSKLIQELVDSPSDTSNKNYKELHDKTQECLLALQNLQINTTTWDPLLLHLLLKRLDTTTRLQFEQSLTSPRDVPTIKQFLDFLERHFQSLEAVNKDKPLHKARVCTSVALDKHKLCGLCKTEGHSLVRCSKFLQLSVSSRLQWVKGHNLCFNCLSPEHRSTHCTARNCKKCDKKHHTLLHVENKIQTKSAPMEMSRNQGSSQHQATAPEASNPAAASLTTSDQSRSSSYILLSTAKVIVKANGKETQCRALLDSGSQINFVSERLVKRLGISPRATSIDINGIGSKNTKIRQRVNVALHSRVSNFNTRLEAAVLPQIISPQPSQEINITEWPIPKNITLADPGFNLPDKIDVLLGAEFYHQFLASGQIQLTDELPILQNTVLGWVIAGRIGSEQLTARTCGICTEEDASLETAISQLWELENVKTSDKVLSASENMCENHFAQTHSINDDGRFMVKIPFSEDPGNLGQSHGIAFNRFLALERRLAKMPDVKAEYIRFMEEYEGLGHMSPINVHSAPASTYFIPHHCILRPESLTTKLRVVFDASTKTSSGLSLNDLMHTGPTIQSELFSILLRFRLPRFVFTTDVEKMYRQILMHPEDRKYQLIIWREDPAVPVRYYELNTVTYGTRAAPYLATKCLEAIAKKNMVRYPLGAKFLLNNFYVDDGLGGADSLSEALSIQQELQCLLKQHGLHLQKWSSNHPQLLQNVSEKEEHEVNCDLTNETVKTLGLTWIPKEDEFCIKVCLNETQQITKRTVTSDVARLFDPLGMVAPIVVTAKIFIQELWEMKLAWDEPLPAELLTRWISFRKELEQINNMKFARHVLKGKERSKIQLHTFTDASEKAFGAAVYIRSVQTNGQVMVRLLCAKSRVAPLKRQTLPRLELCAALLGAELTAKVRKDLKFEETTSYLWTDSEIVLAWVNSQSSIYQTFVANRIAAIHELSLVDQWRHVGTKENPADALSRGLSPRKLAACNLWLYGPLFLHGREECWPPKYTKPTAKPNNRMELKRTSAVTITSDTTTSIIYNINHKGSFKTLQRIVGYLFRFSNNTQKKKGTLELALTVKELEEALVVIIRAMQAAEFEEELKQLKTSHEVSKSSKYISLSPFLDSNGIMRAGGRLEASGLSYDAKHPMIIPYNDPITILIIQMFHEQNRHCGPGALLSHVRQRFWPIKGSTLTRSVVKQCVQCTRAKPKLFNQIMGNLPATRVQPARPFINSGVDFCGPFWVHYKVRGKKPQKAYLAIFCCFVTKAVHLELVSDLTTEAFLGAIRRFISRRGHCQNLYCDNATNFVGASNQLKELAELIHSNTAKGTISKECASKGITFHFIPPRAPHFGGLWEAAVKSAKHLLVRSTSTASLTYEELDTVIIEIEGILNSRPLSPMSENPNDLAALTPGHFLIGEPLNAQVDATAGATKMGLLTRWKQVAHLKNEFWQRWSKEYLCELQYRHKWKTQRNNAKVGDMVIIKEDNTPPLQWPLGRIEKVYHGDDNMVRVADVKTSTGMCKRPIARLAPLPMNMAKTDDTTVETNGAEASHNQEDQPPEIPKKKRRTSINHTLMTIVVAIMLLPLVLGAQYNNKQFETNLGIHFENIGSAAVSSTEWQLLVYYDLQNFWTELNVFSNSTKALNQLCDEMLIKITCTGAVKHFNHAEEEIMMSSTLLSGRRHKRAALDLVGNIAHSLFGVLDSQYAEEMAQTISQVKNNEHHLLKLLKNQTSIIDSTINIMKTDQEAVKEKFHQIDLQLTKIYNKVYNDSEEKQQERVFRMFASLSLQLIIMAANLQRTQAAILDVLMNTHHGIISPLLLTPKQLRQEIEKITFHLPESLDLPVQPEQALELYKIMKVKGGLAQNTIIFSITLPLIERNKFDLLHLIEIPNWINNTLVSIKSCSPFLAINTKRNQYFIMNKAELKSCTKLKAETYLCWENQIRHEAGAARCACEIDLLQNKTQPNCKVQRLNDNTTWIPLWHKNNWIYAMSVPSSATAVCNTEINQITLTGSGLLTLSPGCVLKHDFTSVYGHQFIQSSLNVSYTKLWNATQQFHIIQTEPQSNETQTIQYSTQIHKLTALQDAIAAQEILQLPNKLDVHNYHHTAIGYSALIITVGIVVYLWLKHKRKLPVPAPRTSYPTSETTCITGHSTGVTSEFTVHI